MSKSKRGGRGISNNITKTATPRSARPTVRLMSPITITTHQNPSHPIQYDRRVFTPTRSVTLGAHRRHATRIIAVDKLGDAVRRQTKAPLAFAVPDKVALCVRRKTRKQVIHAKGHAGKKTRRPRRNFWSDIKC